VVQHFHGRVSTTEHETPDFATYDGGTTVLDYILLDENLIDCVCACGYEPFQARVFSDHRAVYVDFDTKRLFGSCVQPLAPMPKRELKSTRPQHVREYFQNKWEYLLEQHFFRRLKTLQELEGRGIPNHKLAQKLDTILIDASLYAEKRCTRSPGVPYSPEITSLRYRFGAYRMILFQMKHNRDLSTQILAKISTGLKDFIYPTTLEHCQQLYNETKKELKAAELDERKTGDRRDHFLEDLATIMAKNGNATKAQYLKQLRHTERMGRVYQHTRFAMGKHKDGGLTTLDVPVDPDADPKQCTDWKPSETPKTLKLSCVSAIKSISDKQKKPHWDKNL